MNKKQRLLSLYGMAMIGDAFVGFFAPDRHLKAWKGARIGLLDRLSDFFEDHHGLMRGFAIAEAFAGAALVRRAEA